eukprot:PhF_6_TR44462/c0_g1_i1/m.68443
MTSRVIIKNPFGLPSDMSPLPLLRVFDAMGMEPSIAVLTGKYPTQTINTSDSESSDDESDVAPPPVYQQVQPSPPPLPQTPSIPPWELMPMDPSKDPSGPDTGKYLIAMALSERRNAFIALTNVLVTRLSSDSDPTSAVTSSFDYLLSEAKLVKWMYRRILISDQKVPAQTRNSTLSRAVLDLLPYLELVTPSSMDSLGSQSGLVVWQSLLDLVRVVLPVSIIVVDTMADGMVMWVPVSVRQAVRSQLLTYLRSTK